MPSSIQILRVSLGSRDLAGAHGLFQAKPLLCQLRLRHHIRPGFQFFDFSLELLQVMLTTPLAQRPDRALQQLGRQFLVFIHKHGRQQAASVFFQSQRHRIDSLLLSDQEGQEQGIDPMSLALEEDARSLLATVLMDEHEELTPELLESAIRSLRKRRGEHDLEQLQRKVKELESRPDVMSKAQLAQERLRLKQAMRSGEITTTEGHS